MYEAHFGWADSPFHIAPDLRFYVDVEPHRAAAQALRAGLAQGDEFMLLTGDFGAGKTIVVRRLLEDFPRERHHVGLLSGQRIEGDELFERIAEALAVEEFEARHPLVALTRVLEGYGREGRDALLVIDEAHRLDVHSLRRLRKLTGVHAGRRSVLHVALVGRHAPAGIAELEKIGRPLHVGMNIVLGALDAAAGREYVLRRLERAGWTGRPSFADDALAEIHERCGGNPGRINRLCSHVLLQLYMKGLDVASAGFVRAVDELIASELEGGDPEAPVAPAPAPAGGETTSTLPPTAAPASLAVAEPARPSVIGDDVAPRPEPPSHEAGIAAPATAAVDADRVCEPAPFRERASPIDLELLAAGPGQARLPALRTDSLVALQDWQLAGPPRRRRAWLFQGLAAVVIFVSGGVTWQFVSDWLAGSATGETAMNSAAGTPPGERVDAAQGVRGGTPAAASSNPGVAPAEPGAATPLDAAGAQPPLATGPAAAGREHAAAAPGRSAQAKALMTAIPTAALPKTGATAPAGLAERGAGPLRGAATAGALCSTEAHALGLCGRPAAGESAPLVPEPPTLAPASPTLDPDAPPHAGIGPPIHAPLTSATVCDPSSAALGLCPQD
jgi:type II secretory pathway predicted ATPase ExeA